MFVTTVYRFITLESEIPTEARLALVTTRVANAPIIGQRQIRKSKHTPWNRWRWGESPPFHAQALPKLIELK